MCPSLNPKAHWGISGDPMGPSLLPHPQQAAFLILFKVILCSVSLEESVLLPK